MGEAVYNPSCLDLLPVIENSFRGILVSGDPPTPNINKPSIEAAAGNNPIVGFTEEQLSWLREPPCGVNTSKKTRVVFLDSTVGKVRESQAKSTIEDPILEVVPAGGLFSSPGGFCFAVAKKADLVVVVTGEDVASFIINSSLSM